MYKIKNDLFTFNELLPIDLYHSLGELFSAFKRANKEIYLVGGCVRDLLLDKCPKDYDLCTNATPEEIKKILNKFMYKTYDSGIKHGTITVADTCYRQTYEITTYRVDGKYTDGRHPDEVQFTASLEEDLKRRDFTINSFAYDYLRKELLMLEESFLRDLEFGIIRTVGDPAERYEEDALRMLRCLRFSAQLNFSIEKYTYKAISMCGSLLKNISKERIRDELTKIILSDNPQVLELLVLSNIEEYLFDDLCPLTEILKCDHCNPYHYTDVFHHTMDVIKAVPKKFELRFAALFHDLGKPFVKQYKEGYADRFCFHGHEEVSADLALQLMNLLKFSNDQKELIYKYVKYHDFSLSSCKLSRFKKVVADIGKENFLDFMKLRKADSAAHRLLQSTDYAIDAIDKVYSRFADLLENEKALTIKDLDINGYDLMDLGFEGKQIGECLNYLLDQVLEETLENNKEKLLEKAKTYKISAV
jgi:tRNA nucleotidyltransferase (CCA-adding enzyme)